MCLTIKIPDLIMKTINIYTDSLDDYYIIELCKPFERHVLGRCKSRYVQVAVELQPELESDVPSLCHVGCKVWYHLTSLLSNNNPSRPGSCNPEIIWVVKRRPHMSGALGKQADG